MLLRFAAGVALACALAAFTPLTGEGVGFARASAAETPAKAGHGAIVVAASSEASAPARALAHELYRDAALRPSIDEATAQVLAGGAPAEENERLRELAAIVASIPTAQEEAISRRLLVSLGAEHGAELVVAVTMEGGRPVAKALRVSGARYERIELGATVETDESGQKSYHWPGAATALAALSAPPRASTPAKPLATRPLPAKPTPKPAPKKERSAWSSPWFWGSLGGVAAVGLTVFVLSQTTSGPSTVHIDGRISP